MGIQEKFRLSMLFATLIALLGFMGYLFGGSTGLVVGLVFALGMNFFSYFYSHKMVVKMYGAQPLKREVHGWAHDKVEALAEKSGIPKPEVYLMDQRTPNAFATGRNPDNSIVCVTSGLLDSLDREEVEGVLAHEIAHIKNRDTLIQSIAGVFGGAISLLAQILWFSSLDGEARNPLLMIGGMILAPLAASMVQMAISRSREFLADSSAAEVTDPVYLADALKSIENSVSANPMKSGAKGASHLFIINPFKKDTLSKLFSTHPPTEERIKRLEGMKK